MTWLDFLAIAAGIALIMVARWLLRRLRHPADDSEWEG